MTKKFKIKDLDNEADLTSRSDKDYTKISIDDLKDETKIDLVLPQKSPEKINEKPKKPKDNPSPTVELKKVVPAVAKAEAKPEKIVAKAEVISDHVRFNRHQLHSYILKVLSYATVLIIIDLVIHFLKRVDDIDVLKLDNYHSIYFGQDLNWNVIRVGCFLLFIFLITSNEKLVVNKKGIYCSKIDLINFLFTSSKVYLSWDEIAEVKYKIKFFEPYLYFYGKNEKQLGQVDFFLENADDFFKYIEQNAGKDHPLYKAKAQLASI